MSEPEKYLTREEAKALIRWIAVQRSRIDTLRSFAAHEITADQARESWNQTAQVGDDAIRALGDLWTEAFKP